MNTRLVEELARQRQAEMVRKASRPRLVNPRERRGPSLRSHTGWAIVAIGLRIAESDRRYRSVAAAGYWH